MITVEDFRAVKFLKMRNMAVRQPAAHSEAHKEPKEKEKG
jgi:hypothetical protein